MITLDVIRRHARAMPTAIALEHADTRLTWRDYAAEVERILPWVDAQLHSDLDVVAVESDVSAAVFVCTSAVATLGVPWVALDPAQSPAVREEQLRAVEPTMLLRTLDERLVITTSAGAVKYADIPTLTGTPISRQRDFRAIGFTSGTTGTPKLVLRDTPSEKRRTAMFIARFGFNRTDRFLLCLPLSHASSHGWARTFLAAGSSVVIEQPDSTAVATQITENAITATLLVPPMLTQVLAELASRSHGQRLRSSLRFLLTGGRHVPATLVGQVHSALGPVLHSYYGTTETGVNVMADPTDLLIDPRTSGRVLDGSHVAVLDDDDQPLAEPGDVGRIAIASYMSAQRYANAAIPSVDIDDRHYVLTTDVGRFEQNGTLRILGRSSRCASATACGDLLGLEDDVRLLPDVTDVAAQVAADGTSLSVVLALRRQPTTEPALLKYLAARIAVQRRVQLPVSVHTVERLVFSSTGKFDLTTTLAPTSLVTESLPKN
ncbi:acyl-coenzyme A synthetase/AMP-(fatty) acid ligase [Rathayibacter agropyri]